MRLVAPDIEINPDNPFENDKLNRKPFAESLFNLITRTEDNIVISLDAPWGDGKTTFVQMWYHFLHSKGVNCLYFDAFANDSFEDPFMALVGNMNLLIEQQFPKKKSDEKLQELKAKAVKVGRRLLSIGANAGVKAVTLNILDCKQLKDVVEDIASDTGECASKFVENTLNNYEEVMNATAEFRKKLGDIANDAYVQNKKPLVFIVDELDRCKPTYALELIEKIKHLFAVKHIVFILVMHADQLCESVKCIYGQNIDARMYLQKFINLTVRLPKCEERIMDSPPSEVDYAKYCRYLSELHGLPAGEWEVLWRPARIFRLSLRDMQRCFTNLALFFAASEDNTYTHYSLLSFLVILKVKRPDVFENIKLMQYSVQDLTRLFFNVPLSSKEQKWGKQVEEILEVCLMPEERFSIIPAEDKLRKIWDQLQWDHNFIERSSVLSHHYKKLEAFNLLQQ